MQTNPLNRPSISLAPLRDLHQLFNLSYPDLPHTSSFPSSLATALSLLFLSDGGERRDSRPAGPPPHPEGGRHSPLFSSVSQYPVLLTANTPHISSECSQMIRHAVGRVTDTARAARCGKTDWKERERWAKTPSSPVPAYWRSCNPQKRPALFLLKPERHGCSSCWCCHCLSKVCLSRSLSLPLSQALIEKVPQTDKCTETLPHTRIQSSVSYWNIQYEDQQGEPAD